MTNIITESHDSPPYFQHLLVPTSYPICKTMLINQVLVDSVLRTNYLTLLLTEVIKVILAIKVAKLFPIRECSIHP
jgi:hypothetical protein